MRHGADGAAPLLAAPVARSADAGMSEQAGMSVEGSMQPPDSRRLEHVLGHMLGAGAAIVERTQNLYTSSFASEVVTCRQGDGAVCRLLCKYGPTGVDSGHGHRGGVAYEGAVYRHALEPAALGAPRLWGVHDERGEGRTWLVIEYLDNAERLAWRPEGMGMAATWIARFHVTMERRVDAPELAFLRRYDEDYLAGWAARAELLVSEVWKRRFPWWPRVCERFGECARLLLEAPATVIHGEYYPKNILCVGDVVQPVDWESAAVGPGEADLASLLEGWPEELVRECVASYQRARWPLGSPAGFERVLDAARVYFGLRWLGDHAALTEAQSSVRRFDGLGKAARRLGLID